MLFFGRAAEIVPLACDVIQDDAVAWLMEDCHACFGRIDVPVNNKRAPTVGGPVQLNAAQWNA